MRLAGVHGAGARGGGLLLWWGGAAFAARWEEGALEALFVDSVRVCHRRPWLWQWWGCGGVYMRVVVPQHTFRLVGGLPGVVPLPVRLE